MVQWYLQLSDLARAVHLLEARDSFEGLVGAVHNTELALDLVEELERRRRDVPEHRATARR